MIRERMYFDDPFNIVRLWTFLLRLFFFILILIGIIVILVWQLQPWVKIVMKDGTPVLERIRNLEIPEQSSFVSPRDQHSRFKFYRVRQGDTFDGIAAMHNVSRRDLQDYNGVFDDQIYVGQRLKIPR